MPLAIDQLHGKAQSAIAHHIVTNRCALATMRTTVDRAIEIGLLADPNVIRHLGNNRASHGAMRADILAQRHRSTGWRRRAGFGHTHAAELKHAEPGETTGRKTRTAQKGAAIKPTVGFTGAGKRGAPAPRNLPIWSPGEHR
jgi:hypothetical protein